MPDLPLTAFDVAACWVVGLSVLVAYLRGAIRELLTIATWLGAGVVAFYGFRTRGSWPGGPSRRNGWPTRRRCAWCSWCPDRLVVAAVLADHIPGGHVATVDRIAGAAFGLARGALVVCLAYLGLTILVAPEDHPDGSRTRSSCPTSRTAPPC